MDMKGYPQCLGRLFPRPTTSPSRGPPASISGNPPMLVSQAEKFFDKGDVDEGGAIDAATASRLRTLLSKMPSPNDGEHAACWPTTQSNVCRETRR